MDPCVSWGGDIKFNTKDEKCAEVWLQWPLPLACSWLKPFKRPTTKGECESGMGGTIEGRGKHKLWRDISKNCLTCPPLKVGTNSSPVSLSAPERIFGYFCNLFWAISHCLLDDVRTYLFLPKNSPSRPPNFRNNTNIIDLNMLETPNVWIHSQHGAGGFFCFVLFFCKWACNTQRRQVAVPRGRQQSWDVHFSTQIFLHISMHVPSVGSHPRYPWDTSDPDGILWSCIPNSPLADADALCAWHSLWDESTGYGESATYVWAGGDLLPQCFWWHKHIPKV